MILACLPAAGGMHKGLEWASRLTTAEQIQNYSISLSPVPKVETS